MPNVNTTLNSPLCCWEIISIRRIQIRVVRPIISVFHRPNTVGE